jgi:hypothetical protein
VLEHALKYARRGWSVLPVMNKRPLLSSWTEYQQHRATEEEIRAWWTQWPKAGIGIATGRVSNIIVIDVDSEEGLRALGTIPPTLTARTQRGGFHLYFEYVPGVPNCVGVVKNVDVRSDGGMVVAPPSRGEYGQYTWENPGVVPSLPSLGLLALVRSSGTGRRLEGREWATDIGEGARDQELTRRTGRLLQVGMPAAECLSVMLAVNRAHCKPPLADAQVEKIVRSIAEREAGKPGRTEQKEFKTTTTREMLRRYGEDDSRWTIAEWLPEASCGLIVAPPGSYKTWLLVALAFAVSTGKPFLGRYPVTGRGSVLFVQQEDPWWMLQSRLARMFNASAPGEEDGTHELDCGFVQELDAVPIYWHEDRELNLEDTGCLARFRAKIAEIRPRLVVIDPLYSAISAKEYMALGAQAMLSLKRLRDEYHSSFAIAHHTTVAGSSSEDRSSIWGSQFLNAWLEWGWRLPEGDERGNIVIRHFKSCENPKRIRLKFNITDWSFGVDVDESCASVADRIEEAIMSGTPKSMRAIAEGAGCSLAAVHRVIKKMGLSRDEDGHYILPPK